MSEAFVVCDGWMTASTGKNKAEVLICSELLGNSSANFWPLSWWRKMSTNHQLLTTESRSSHSTWTQKYIKKFSLNLRKKKFFSMLWSFHLKYIIFFFYIYLISVFVAYIFINILFGKIYLCTFVKNTRLAKCHTYNWIY